MVFIDLKKAYDSIPWDIVWDSFKARGISQSYIETIRNMYNRVSTNIRTQVGITESIPIKVGLHQRLALRSFHFYGY